MRQAWRAPGECFDGVHKEPRRAESAVLVGSNCSVPVISTWVRSLPRVDRAGFDDGWLILGPHFLNFGVPSLLVDYRLADEAGCGLEIFGVHRPEEAWIPAAVHITSTAANGGIWGNQSIVLIASRRFGRGLEVLDGYDELIVMVGDTYAVQLTWSALLGLPHPFVASIPRALLASGHRSSHTRPGMGCRIPALTKLTPGRYRVPVLGRLGGNPRTRDESRPQLRLWLRPRLGRSGHTMWVMTAAYRRMRLMSSSVTSKGRRLWLAQITRPFPLRLTGLESSRASC
jgi:hypothetical protein